MAGGVVFDQSSLSQESPGIIQILCVLPLRRTAGYHNIAAVGISEYIDAAVIVIECRPDVDEFVILTASKEVYKRKKKTIALSLQQTLTDQRVLRISRRMKLGCQKAKPLAEAEHLRMNSLQQRQLRLNGCQEAKTTHLCQKLRPSMRARKKHISSVSRKLAVEKAKVRGETIRSREPRSH